MTKRKTIKMRKPKMPFFTSLNFLNIHVQMYIKERRKIREGHSNLQIKNKLTTPWLKKKKTNRETKVHKTQHRKLNTKQHELHQNLL